MKTVNFDFKGLLCPVFTPITADRKTINYDVIEKYCCWLKQKGIRGVLVNGAISEGCCLRIDERKRITEEWVRVCRKNEMICMVQIGGCSITDVHDLAEHAEKIGVCAVVCWPDLFFRPTCEEDLVEYLRDISKHCPTRPLYYDHHPEKTAVWLDMARLCDLLEQQLTTFCGLKYTCHDLAKCILCLKQGRNIIWCDSIALCAGLTTGVDACCLSTLSICPELVIECHNAICNGKLREAQEAQIKLTRRVCDITRNLNCDWIETMKTEFNKTHSTLNCGPCRKPLLKLNKRH